MSRHLGWRLFAVIVVLGAAAALVLTRPARLGLDLRGGTQIVLEASDTARQKVDRDTVDRTLEVLRRRAAGWSATRAPSWTRKCRRDGRSRSSSATPAGGSGRS